MENKKITNAKLINDTLRALGLTNEEIVDLNSAESDAPVVANPQVGDRVYVYSKQKSGYVTKIKGDIVVVKFTTVVTKNTTTLFGKEIEVDPYTEIKREYVDIAVTDISPIKPRSKNSNKNFKKNKHDKNTNAKNEIIVDCRSEKEKKQEKEEQYLSEMLGMSFSRAVSNYKRGE